MTLPSGKTILIAASDWGMGHCVRTAALITKLSGSNRIIAGRSQANAFFFERFFGNLPTVSLPSYSVRYSTRLPAWCAVVLKLPRILSAMRTERRLLETYRVHFGLDMVISDCRFGLHSKGMKSVLINHQLRLTGVPFRRLGNRILRGIMERFDEVWVPDHANENVSLSGILSHPLPRGLNASYIGPLSDCPPAGPSVARWDFLLILSGPEPQRSELLKIFERLVTAATFRTAIAYGAERADVSGKPWEGIAFADSNELAAMCAASKAVICRSGYSTLMDMHAIGPRKLILIPTPGQPEQEYLASHWAQTRGSTQISQHVFASCELADLI